jgi:hypothetical protein
MGIDANEKNLINTSVSFACYKSNFYKLLAFRQAQIVNRAVPPVNTPNPTRFSGVNFTLSFIHCLCYAFSVPGGAKKVFKRIMVKLTFLGFK